MALACGSASREADEAQGGSLGRFSREGVVSSTAHCGHIHAYFLAHAARAVGQPEAKRANAAAALVAIQIAQRSALDDGVSLTTAVAAARRKSTKLGALADHFEASDRAVADLVRRRENAVEDPAAPLAAIEAQLTGERTRRENLRNEMTRQWRDYWTLRFPRPASLEAVQSALAPKEMALLVNAGDAWDAPAVVIAVTRDAISVETTDLTSREISRAARTLRAQIDADAPEKLSPVSLKLAHLLHKALLQKPSVSRLAASSDAILAIPSTILEGLPLGVLVASPPSTEMARTASQLRDADWLIRSRAISTFPSLAALVELRRATPKRASASASFIAFADPDFGTGSNMAAAAPASNAAAQNRSAWFIARGFPELEPLAPAGSEEMRAIARALGDDPARVQTGAAVTEALVKQLSAQGRLESHSVIGFATHGLLPGNTSLLREPALALSIPRPGDKEDGLLTASEVAGMRLSVDLILLSACHTGSTESGRSLIPLSRAFLQAGARGLVVTQWQVRNDIGPIVLPELFRRTRAQAKLSTAHALQAAALEVMKRDDVRGAHPKQWAAYNLVGDGDW